MDEWDYDDLLGLVFCKPLQFNEIFPPNNIPALPVHGPRWPPKSYLSRLSPARVQPYKWVHLITNIYCRVITGLYEVRKHTRPT